MCSLLSIDTLSLGRKGSRQSVASLGSGRSGLGIEDETDQDYNIPAASPAREAEAQEYEEYDEPVPAAAKKQVYWYIFSLFST